MANTTSSDSKSPAEEQLDQAQLIEETGSVRTPNAFHIIDGRLHLGTIELVDKETGKAMNLREARNSEGPMKTIKEIQNNIDSIKEQVDGLKP